MPNGGSQPIKENYDHDKRRFKPISSAEATRIPTLGEMTTKTAKSGDLIQGYCYDSEEVRMTLQVTLVGTDGIVVASDKKVNLLNQNFNTTALRSKILINSDRKIAACWSGEQFPSYSLAEHIVLNMNDADLQFPYRPLRIASNEILSRRGIHGEEYASAEVVVVTIQNNPKAYEVTAARDRCDCFEAPDKIVKGHIANPGLSSWKTWRHLTRKSVGPADPTITYFPGADRCGFR